MKFVNKACRSEEISDIIKNMVEPMEELKAGELPLAIMTRYIKNGKTGQLTSYFMVGTLEYPITLFDEPDEGDNMVYLAMKFNFFAEKKKEGEEEITKGHMFFPRTSTIIDMNKEWENYEKGIPNRKVEITENTVELMIYGAQNYNIKELTQRILAAKEHPNW